MLGGDDDGGQEQQHDAVEQQHNAVEQQHNAGERNGGADVVLDDGGGGVDDGVAGADDGGCDPVASGDSICGRHIPHARVDDADDVLTHHSDRHELGCANDLADGRPHGR